MTPIDDNTMEQVSWMSTEVEPRDCTMLWIQWVVDSRSHRGCQSVTFIRRTGDEIKRETSPDHYSMPQNTPVTNAGVSSVSIPVEYLP